MKELILKTLVSLCLFGTDNTIEVTSSGSAGTAKKNADLNADFRLIKEGKTCYCLLSPRVNISSSGHFSSGFGLGLRKELRGNFVGMHLFGDYSYLYGSHHFQVGPCIEYLHPKWNATVNYYFPISNGVYSPKNIVSATHHLEGSVFYKFLLADLGLEPSYNWGEKKFGMVGHAVIPMRMGNLNISVGRNARHADHARVGLSFPLYGSKASMNANKIRREVGVISHIRSVPLPAPVAPVELPAIEEPKQEESQSWWDYLFGWLMPTEEELSRSSIEGWGEYDDWGSDWDYSYDRHNTDHDVVSFNSVGTSTDSQFSSSASFSGHDYSGDVDSPASTDSCGSAADTPSLSDSAFLDSIGTSLAEQGGYSISVDSCGDVGMATLGSADSLPSMDTGCYSEAGSSGSEFDMVTPNPGFSP